MDAPSQIPARMLNEYVYCPRLCALEWVHCEWADNADTIRGQTVHRRVDRESGAGLPEPDEDRERPVKVRSVLLSDEALHLVARIDLVESEDGLLVPVDYKKGRVPKVPEGAWEPERVQICAQGLLLRAHGYDVSHGVLYFAGSRRRVRVELSEELVRDTLRYRDGALELASRAGLPPPLVDSPKCDRCSLVGICLPQETNWLLQRSREIRPIIPRRDDALPLYVQVHGGWLGKDHDEIVIRERKKEVGRVRMEDPSRVALLGNISISGPLLRALAQRDIPVSFHSWGGWLWGTFTSVEGRNVMLRIAQHGVASRGEAAMSLARGFVHGKILNCRVLLRRNGSGELGRTLDLLKDLAHQANRAETLQELMGYEGAAARAYFERFPSMLKCPLGERFDALKRTRRPPLDEVNAMLSFVYACLARELTNIVHGVGFDPYVGFLHQPRFGRPALALDLMEEFRPVLGDSAVISALNNGVVREQHFTVHPTGVSLTDAGRQRFIQVYERRLDELARHPVFGTTLSYRRILEVQARLLGRVLMGELQRYPEYRIR